MLFFLSCIIGDIGKQDADGFLYIVDRLKELIKYKAFQVAPASLEDILLRHESVADAGVVGIPDEAAGELPRAYVVKRPGTQVTEKDIQDFVAGMEVILNVSCLGLKPNLRPKGPYAIVKLHDKSVLGTAESKADFIGLPHFYGFLLELKSHALISHDNLSQSKFVPLTRGLVAMCSRPASKYQTKLCLMIFASEWYL